MKMIIIVLDEPVKPNEVFQIKINESGEAIIKKDEIFNSNCSNNENETISQTSAYLDEDILLHEIEPNLNKSNQILCTQPEYHLMSPIQIETNNTIVDNQEKISPNNDLYIKLNLNNNNNSNQNENIIFDTIEDIEPFKFKNDYLTKKSVDISFDLQNSSFDEQPDTPNTKIKKNKKKSENVKDCLHVWEFLRDLLKDEKSNGKLIKWLNKEKGIFKIIRPNEVSNLWGRKKANKAKMDYPNMARGIRYSREEGGYFDLVSKDDGFGKKLVYKFSKKASLHCEWLGSFMV